MKNFKHLLYAFAVCVLAACHQENLPVDRTDTTVEFSVNVPNAILTKGTINDGAKIADGTNVNSLHYAIYMTEDGTSFSVDEPQSAPLAQGLVELVLDPIERTRSTSITYNLVKNQNYTIIYLFCVLQ